MKITPSLVTWMQGELQRRKLSYRAFGQLAGTNFQNVQRVATLGVDFCSPEVEDALCRGFGITKEQLLLIAEGKAPIESARYDVECETARALWRWVAYDARRIAMLRAMGFEGVLPDPVHEKGKKG